MTIHQLHPQHWTDWRTSLAPDSKILLIDVREAWELELAHLPADTVGGLDFRHIPLNHLPAQAASISALCDESTVVLCLCHHGVRSMHAARFLASQDIENIINIQGGISAWADGDARIAHY